MQVRRVLALLIAILFVSVAAPLVAQRNNDPNKQPQRSAQHLTERDICPAEIRRHADESISPTHDADNTYADARQHVLDRVTP